MERHRMGRGVEPEPAPPAPARPSGARIAVACIIVALFLAVGVGYHDGAFAVDTLDSATEPGMYRFKGVLESYDEEAEQIVLRDDSGTRELHWNITMPAVDKWYMVSAEVVENATTQERSLEALALSPVYLLRG